MFETDYEMDPDVQVAAMVGDPEGRPILRTCRPWRRDGEPELKPGSSIPAPESGERAADEILRALGRV